MLLMISKVFPTIMTLSVEQQEMNPMVRGNTGLLLMLRLMVSIPDADSDAY